MLEKWNNISFPSSRIQTSVPFAKLFGFERIPVLEDMLMNLAIGMVVDVFSETCSVHLGIQNCSYVKPVYAGDFMCNGV